jgi:predicted amidophosphoribosyltransferase
VPTVLVVRIDVNECWAVDLHWRGDQRTPLGDLLHRAKTYANKPGERAAAEQLGRCLAWWADHLARDVPVSNIGTADVVCCVPDNPPKVPYNLPEVLGAHVAAALGVEYAPRLLRKVRPTSEVKYTVDRDAKVAELRSAFVVDGDVAGKVVVVVDDLVLSGATLETIARALRHAGARKVFALTATKAHKGLGPT